jgi:hypothetical protein
VPWLRMLVVWVMLMAVEILHGISRTVFLVPVVGDARARQIGVVSGSALNLGVTCLIAPWIGVRSNRVLLGIGACWASLTLLFEVAFGRRVARMSWARIREDYDLAHGGLLPFGLVALALSPLIAARLRSPQQESATAGRERAE